MSAKSQTAKLVQASSDVDSALKAFYGLQGKHKAKTSDKELSLRRKCIRYDRLREPDYQNLERRLFASTASDFM